MLNNVNAVLGQLLLGWLVAISLLAVGYLAWLKVLELRKKRFMAARGERFGLIQEIRPSRRPAAARSLAGAIASQAGAALGSVPGADTGAQRWTLPVGKPPAVSGLWN